MCKRGDISRNPLMIKAEQFRKDGAFEDARRFLRQAVARYPDAPETYLALGKLCEEELDDKLEAIYCYRNFLQFIPDGDPRKAEVEKFLRALEKSFAEQAVARSAEVAELQKNNRNMQTELLLAKRLILSKQRKISELEKKLKTVPSRRKRR